MQSQTVVNFKTQICEIWCKMTRHRVKTKNTLKSFLGDFGSFQLQIGLNDTFPFNGHYPVQISTAQT